MLETFTKIGSKVVIDGIIMVCEQSPCTGCSKCDVLNMNVICDDWLCSSKHRPDGNDVMFKAERFEINGKTYVKTPYEGCSKCAFSGNSESEQPCSSCNEWDSMYKLWEE